MTKDQLLKRANKGNRKALAIFLERFGSNAKDLIHNGWGDLHDLACVSRINTVFEGQIATRRAVFARVEQLKGELGAAGSTPLEKLVIERIAMCWVDVHVADLHRAQNKDTRTKIIDALERRHERAERRYLRAIKALAAIRKLDLTAIQINVSAGSPGVGA